MDFDVRESDDAYEDDGEADCSDESVRPCCMTTDLCTHSGECLWPIRSS